MNPLVATIVGAFRPERRDALVAQNADGSMPPPEMALVAATPAAAVGPLAMPDAPGSVAAAVAAVADAEQAGAMRRYLALLQAGRDAILAEPLDEFRALLRTLGLEPSDVDADLAAMARAARLAREHTPDSDIRAWRLESVSAMNEYQKLATAARREYERACAAATKADNAAMFNANDAAELARLRKSNPRVFGG